MKNISLRLSVLAVATTAALLAGCSREEDTRTAGQKIDGAIAQTERKAQELEMDATAAGRELKEKAGNATDAVANKSRDLAITAELNALLAKDERLSATRINVDTSNGQVVLRGTAPDAAARSRATDLAEDVEGVVSVNNQLTVQPSGN